jgi:hypothetical protein
MNTFEMELFYNYQVLSLKPNEQIISENHAE